MTTHDNEDEEISCEECDKVINMETDNFKHSDDFDWTVAWGVYCEDCAKKIDDEEEPNECDKCGWKSYKYSTEPCEELGDDYYCEDCIRKAMVNEEDSDDEDEKAKN